MSDDDEGFIHDKYFVASFGGGVAFLLLFLTLCVVFVLLCVIMRRLSKLSRFVQQLTPAYANEQIAVTDKRKQTYSVEPSLGTELSNTGAADEVDDAAIAAMYAVVPEEHRQMKKMKKLSVQQYDDVNLLPFTVSVDVGGGGGEDETKMIASGSGEGGGGEGEGYSRLCHAGPRMDNVKTRHLNSSLSMSSPQLLEDREIKRKSRTTSMIADGGYSQIERPQSKLLVPAGVSGGYTLIEHEKDSLEMPAPPLPDRIRPSRTNTESGLLKTTKSENATTSGEIEATTTSTTTTTIPYQNIGERGGDPGKAGAGYSMVANPASPKPTEDDFFGDVLEFHNTQAQEIKDIYEKVN